MSCNPIFYSVPTWSTVWGLPRYGDYEYYEGAADPAARQLYHPACGGYIFIRFYRKRQHPVFHGVAEKGHSKAEKGICENFPKKGKGPAGGSTQSGPQRALPLRQRQEV